MSLSTIFISSPKKFVNQLRLLTKDPKKFIDNLDYTLNPEKMHLKLLGLESMVPICVNISAREASAPHLNILLPKLDPAQLTGGTNTALNIAYLLAHMGIPVRILTVDQPLPIDLDKLWDHLASVTGATSRPINISFGSTFYQDDPQQIGSKDVFLATYWTTAYRLKFILPRMEVNEFFYLIQDFEPGFYPWSSAFAQVLETYGMRFHGLINERLVANYLIDSRSGQFADPTFLERCAVFDPAVDRTHFYPTKPTTNRKRLLFYARPNHPRNMFGIGFEALRVATRHELFSGGNWDFVAMGGGDEIGKMDLGGGRYLYPAPWRNYQTYAELIRESDILLSLMLSPHTSYPVIEMAACRGFVVTNSFMNKTQATLNDISPRIIAAQPDIESIAAGLVGAAERIDRGPSTEGANFSFPTDWSSALQGAVAKTHAIFSGLVQKATVSMTP
jgi:hypothetical protein